MPNTSTVAQQRSADRWKLLTLLTITLMIRGRVTEFLRSALVSDDYGYLDMARNLIEYGTLGWGFDPYQPLATRPPLYVWLLTPCAATYSFAPLLAGVMQTLLGLATVWAVWRLALRWQFSGPAALAAASLVAVDPILMFQGAQATPVSLSACLSVLALHALTSLSEKANIRNAILTAICLALCGLCEPAHLLWIGVVLIFVVVRLLRQSPRPRQAWLTAAVLFAATTSLLAIWPVRNAVVLGYPTPATTDSGYYVLRGNNRDFYDHLSSGQWGIEWDRSGFRTEWRHKTEDLQNNAVALEGFAYQQALANVMHAPLGFAHATLVKLGWLWGLAPRDLQVAGAALPRGVQILCGVWYAAQFLLALAGLRALGRRALAAPWAFGLLLIACYTAANVISWCGMLDRGPLMPVICLLAVVGFAHLWSRPKSLETVESEELAPLATAANLP